MKIVMKDINSIHRYPGNPRRNEHAVPAVKASLDQFGWKQPIVVDSQNVIIVGDTRYQAALLRKDKQVPVLVADDLTPEQVIAYRLADNRVGAIAEDDEERVLAEMQLLLDMGADLDLTSMGFSAEEVAGVMAVSTPKQDIRYLEDFEVMPQAKPKWILISAPEDQCAAILTQLNGMKLKGSRIEYSGVPSTGKKMDKG